MILYLHGFSSAGASSKARQLRELLAPEQIASPDYPSHDPHTAVARLDALVRTCFPTGNARIVGSSLGGYYAQYLASRHPDARAVLINPALNPLEQLRPAIGHHTNMATGAPFEFTPAQHAALGDYDVAVDALGTRCLVLLDAADEVIDYRDAAAQYRRHGQVRVFAGGSHRFEHLAEAVALIRAHFGLPARGP